MNPITLSQQEALRLDYAEPRGFQPGYADIPGFWIWNLRKAIPGHPVNSTVSTETLDAALNNLHRLPNSVPKEFEQFLSELKNGLKADKLAEFSELRELVESPIRFSVTLDSGVMVDVTAVPVHGERGSVGICGGVEITSIVDSISKTDVDVSNDELRWLREETEKRVGGAA